MAQELERKKQLPGYLTLRNFWWVRNRGVGRTELSRDWGGLAWKFFYQYIRDQVYYKRAFNRKSLEQQRKKLEAKKCVFGEHEKATKRE